MKKILVVDTGQEDPGLLRSYISNYCYINFENLNTTEIEKELQTLWNLVTESAYLDMSLFIKTIAKSPW